MAPKIPRGYDQDKFSCCCGSMHVVTGCNAIAIAELLATILAVILLIVFYCVFHSDTYAYQLMVSVGSLAIGLCCCIGAFLAIGCLVVATRAENPVMLIPHMVAQIFALIGMGFAIIAAIITLIGWSGNQFGPDVYLRPSLEGRTQDQYAAQTTGSTVGGIVLALSVIGFFCECWFLSVIFSAYRFFQDRSGNTF